ncbi:MAG: putative glycosyltransferase EpsJ [candidate division WS2 bacterium]|nr:putative glycosyltransferase EpsJ [Candidatus Psychracetigena formicireducens]
MNNPKISVIVPIYNAEKYLEKCLDSIINQTYEKLEIILVNDGSTDRSKEIIQEYKNKDSRIIDIDKENGGIGSAYQIAFEKMTGDYVSFVDSDDYIALEMYEELVAIIEDKKADIIQFGMHLFNESGNIYKTELPGDAIIHENQNILLEHFTKIKTPSLACRIFRSELFKGIKMFYRSVGVDETTYIQLITKCEGYVATDKAYYYVYHRQDSVSRSTYTLEKIREGIQVHEFIINHIEASNDNYINYAYIKYLKYIMLVGLVELDKVKALKNGEVYETLMKNFNKYYCLIYGSNEEKKEKIIFRLELRLFRSSRLALRLFRSSRLALRLFRSSRSSREKQ